MKILSAHVENFGSYEKLEFNFSNQGLTLVAGPTGSGKSTLCDVIPWVLFGVTSKNGTVDEVCSWNSNHPTFGRAQAALSDKIITITRQRNPNDLYYQLSTHTLSAVFRGKDIADTQRLINQELGLNADLYLSGAYFHEFSQTASFFTTTAKNRRQTTEQIVDLSLPTKLTANISDYKKEVKKERDALQKEEAALKSNTDQIKETIETTCKRSEQWAVNNREKISKLNQEFLTFDQTKSSKIKKLQGRLEDYEFQNISEVEEAKSKIKQLEEAIKPQSVFDEGKGTTEESIKKCDQEKCDKCGNSIGSDKKMMYIRQLSDWRASEANNNVLLNQLKLAKLDLRNANNFINPYKEQLENEKAKENTYAKYLEEAQNEENPFDPLAKDNLVKLQELKTKHSSVKKDIGSFTQEHNDLETLSDIIDDFRGLVIKNTIVEVQNSTNQFLQDYFDAELRVEFIIESSDKLNVDITKDGNQCSFTQLSKGQRQLLKLCFGVSVMRCIANHNGVSFNAVFLDEPFDGMDEQLKVKGYRLLEQLATERESVFAIDHSESLKSMFTKRYGISLQNGVSQIEES